MAPNPRLFEGDPHLLHEGHRVDWGAVDRGVCACPWSRLQRRPGADVSSCCHRRTRSRNGGLRFRLVAWHDVGMNARIDDSLERTAARLADLERQVEQVQFELTALVITEAARGVPLAVIGRRVGRTRETIRRWLKNAGRADLVRATPARRSGSTV